MASKHKKKRKRGHKSISERPLNSRVQRALNEGRTQQALDLAKTLYKQEPTQPNRELLANATLSRARELVGKGAYRDVRVLLDNAIAHCEGREDILSEIGVLMACCADGYAALQIAEKITDPNRKKRIEQALADEAVRQRGSLKDHLPETLSGEYEAIIAAFAASERGDDEEARDKLKKIGLRSPFLEWKLFLRGLLAYYAGDDGRAVENWQRLDEKRWPFRLSALFRFQIDREFAGRQSPETINYLNRQRAELQPSPIRDKLESIKADIGDTGRLPRAFNTAESIRKQLKNEAPSLFDRLAHCFYWAIISHGSPEDLKRYRRVFGTPPDDPELTRLEATALEVRGQERDAQECWGEFEKSIAGSAYWPQEQKNRIRSMVWNHMGLLAEIAAKKPGDEYYDEFEDEYYEDDSPTELKLSAPECYQEAIKLAPDQPQSYRHLIQCHLNEEKEKQAIKTARRLLKQCPDDLPTLELLGDLLMTSEQYEEALQWFIKAQEINPLDKDLRTRLSLAHLYSGRHLVEKEKFDEARAAFQSALNTNDRPEKYPILCIWAACEFKANRPEQGWELLEQAFAEQETRLAVIFCILIESIRFKLTKLKPQFNKEFNALLAEAPTVSAACELASTSALLRRAGVHYHGQQTHEKKVRAYLQKSLRCEFSRTEHVRIIDALSALGIKQLLWDFISKAQREFPEDPEFLLQEVEYDLNNPRGWGYGGWRERELLDRAGKLADALPRGERRDEIFNHIRELEKQLDEISPPISSIFSNFFGRGGFNPFGEFYEDDDEDYDEGFPF